MSETGEPQRDFLQPLFPTLLAVCTYPGHAAQGETLASAIYRTRDEDAEGRQRSETDYQMGYTSFYTRRNLRDQPEFQPLAAFICEKATAYAEFLKFDLARFELHMSTFWVNINPRFSYHADHVHPYSHISGVYYVRCTPQSGNIAFRDPRPVRLMSPTPVSERTNENTDVFTLPPEEGRLLLFPAWLTHGVEQNLTQQDRLSISFNFELRPRGG